jgi:hypothetical protein
MTGTYTDAQARLTRYLAQNHGGPLTPAQARRYRHKRNHAIARDNGQTARQRKPRRFAFGEGWGVPVHVPGLFGKGSERTGQSSRRLSGKRTGKPSDPSLRAPGRRTSLNPAGNAAPAAPAAHARKGES